MPSAFKVKPTHKAVKTYYAALATCADQSVEHEGALRSAFQNLLCETGRKVGRTLIPELSLDANGHQIRPDGTFHDEFTIERGYWEAKDTDDDLEAEIKKKIKRGYRLTNTIFEDTRQARLYQNGKLDMIANLRDQQQLCDLLNAFFSHTEPAHEDFNKAVDEFKQRVPDLARVAWDESDAAPVAPSSTPAGPNFSCLRLTPREQNPNILDVTSAMRYYCGADTDGYRVGCLRRTCRTDANPRLGFRPNMAVLSPRGPHDVVGVDVVRVTR